MDYDTWKLNNGEVDYFECPRCHENIDVESDFVLGDDGKEYCTDCAGHYEPCFKCERILTVHNYDSEYCECCIDKARDFEID